MRPRNTDMDKIIQEIYKNLVRDMEEDEISRALKKEVLELLGDSGDYPDMKAYEKCRDGAFAIAGAGEEAGFYRGFRYAFQLFMECRR